MKKIKIVALYGKAGAGKDTILKALMDKWGSFFDLNEIVSCTTRPPREGEVNHVNYHFETVESFTQMVLDGTMLEATEFNNWWYGTPLFALNPDKVNVGVFNPTGVCALLSDSRLEVLPIEIIADDKLRMIRQLNRETKPDVAEICRRYFADEKDFEEFYCNEEYNIDDIAWYFNNNEEGLFGDKIKTLSRIVEAFGQNRLNELE